MTPLIQLKQRSRVLIVAFAVTCFGLSPSAQAVSPPPDGGYAGGNTAEGQAALLGLTTGGYNTAVGFLSLRSNTTNSFNTALGAGALLLNTADGNTATGAAALLSNTTGAFNTATGALALFSNTAFSNTATGANALFSNTTGYENTATGQDALFSNTSGFRNTAIGQGALILNTTANENTATGWHALFAFTGQGITTANTADGAEALEFNTTGVDNTATGAYALISNTTGNGNTAIGLDALDHNTTGINNTALGVGAGVQQTTGSNNIYIGDSGLNSTEANTIRIGASSSTGNDYTDCYIGGIFGNTALGVAVYINSVGHLSTTASSARFKDDIKPMANASEALFALKPVAFHYKKEIDPTGKSQFGLVAEDVEKVNPNLVLPDKEGKPYSVRYDQVNAMLLNEFLKEHQEVQRLEAALAAMNERLKEQDAKIDKVNAKVELTNPAPQVANNGQ